MVILQVETSRGFGGQEEWVLRLSAALMRRGHEVQIACRPGTTVAHKADALSIPRQDLEIRNSLVPAAVLGLLRIVRQEKVEVIHTHDAKTTWAAYFASHLSSLYFNRPVLIRTHHPAYNNRYALSYRYLSDRVVLLSQHLRDYLVAEKGIASSKVHIIPPGVDTDLFSTGSVKSNARQELGISQKAPVIGMVACLRGEKGHRILIEAARVVLCFYPEARFLLVGSGQTEEALHKLVSRWTMKGHFIFTGYRPDVPPLLAAMDIFVLPSLRETMPISLMEAMAMEKPVIASRVGGIPEVLTNKETGLLVPPGDSAALADGILYLLSHPSLAQEWGKNGRRVIEERYSLQSVVDRTIALYQNLKEEICCHAA